MYLFLTNNSLIAKISEETVSSLISKMDGQDFFLATRTPLAAIWPPFSVQNIGHAVLLLVHTFNFSNFSFDFCTFESDL